MNYYKEQELEVPIIINTYYALLSSIKDYLWISKTYFDSNQIMLGFEQRPGAPELI